MSLMKVLSALMTKSFEVLAEKEVVAGVVVIIFRPNCKFKSSAVRVFVAARLVLRDCRFFFSPGFRGLYL